MDASVFLFFSNISLCIQRKTRLSGQQSLLLGVRRNGNGSSEETQHLGAGRIRSWSKVDRQDG